MEKKKAIAAKQLLNISKERRRLLFIIPEKPAKFNLFVNKLNLAGFVFLHKHILKTITIKLCYNGSCYNCSNL
jgi:hypothetical protein